jgi:hypothetical protein
MSDIAKWLEEIGLGEHAGLFADNDIDRSTCWRS